MAACGAAAGSGFFFSGWFGGTFSVLAGAVPDFCLPSAAATLCGGAVGLAVAVAVAGGGVDSLVASKSPNDPPGLLAPARLVGIAVAGLSAATGAGEINSLASEQQNHTSRWVSNRKLPAGNSPPPASRPSSISSPA
jgi:hypothetical protein